MEVDDQLDEAEGGSAAGAGWPLGLPPLTLQIRLANAFSTALHYPAHSSFLHATPTCSSLGSSDLDSESSLFSFQARSITLGSLMGMRSGSHPNLIRAHSLAVASSSSQVSTSHPHHQCCRALELCRKLVIRRQHEFKHIATDSAKLCNNFLIRCAACVQAQQKQTRSSDARMQRIDEDAAAVPSLRHLLQRDRESLGIALPTQRQTVLINIMYEGASNVDNPAQSRRRQCDVKEEAGPVNWRVESNRGGTCLNMGSIKRRVKRKYTRQTEAHLKSPCIPCI